MSDNIKEVLRDYALNLIAELENDGIDLHEEVIMTEWAYAEFPGVTCTLVIGNSIIDELDEDGEGITLTFQ